MRQDAETGERLAMRLSSPEELILGNQITMMRAMLMMLRCAPDVADTYSEKSDLEETIRGSLAVLSGNG